MATEPLDLRPYTGLPAGELTTLTFRDLDPRSPNCRWPGLDKPIWSQFPAPADDSAEARAWRELRDSIQAQGILQPPHVLAPSEPGGQYRILYGFRRIVAAYHLADKDRPEQPLRVVVHATPLTAEQILTLQWLENARRRDLPWTETVRTIATLTAGGWDQRRIAGQLGLSLGLVNLYAQLAQPLAEHAGLADLAGTLLGPSHVRRILLLVERAWKEAKWREAGTTAAERAELAAQRQAEVLAWVVDQLRATAEGQTEFERGWLNEQLIRLERQLATVFATPRTDSPAEALDAATWADAKPKPPAMPVNPWLMQTQRLSAQPAAFEVLNDNQRKDLKEQLRKLIKALG